MARHGLPGQAGKALGRGQRRGGGSLRGTRGWRLLGGVQPGWTRARHRLFGFHGEAVGCGASARDAGAGRKLWLCASGGVQSRRSVGRAGQRIWGGYYWTWRAGASSAFSTITRSRCTPWPSVPTDADHHGIRRSEGVPLGGGHRARAGLQAILPFVESISFSPDGRTLAAPALQDGAVVLSDADSGRELRRLGTGSTGSLTSSSVAFSPDGSRIVTGALNGLVRMWNLP